MSFVPRPFPAVLPHGAIREVLPDLYFVKGTIGLPGPLPVRFSRNMTIVKEGERLVLVNAVRLDDAGLAALDKLGKVTDVIRVAAFHGMDDPFYADRYKAKTWVVKGQRYTSGFDTKTADTYFTPDEEIEASTSLPLADARMYVIAASPPEGLLVLGRHGGVCIAGDCLQHWHKTDEFFSFFARPMMHLMGFIRPHNVGPAWLKQGKPPKSELAGILGLGFANLMPAHGDPVIGDALEKYRPILEKVSV